MSHVSGARRRRRSADAGVAPFTPAAVPSMYIWHDAAQETGYADNAEVATVLDFSGNGRNSTAIAGERPLYKTAVLGGKPAFRFDGSNDVVSLVDLSALTQGEIFVVAKHLVPPASGLGALWAFHGGSNSTYLPFTDGFGYDAFGTTMRVDGMVLSGATESPFIYNVMSRAGLITNRINSTSLNIRNTNVVSFAAVPKIGNNDAGAMNFDVAELILYSAALSPADRASVRNYLASKYTITAGVEYAVWNQLDKGAGIALSNGNRTDTASAAATVRATIGKSSGKWYWEINADAALNDSLYGVANASAGLAIALGLDANGWSYYSASGNTYNNLVATAYGALWTTADKIMVALDMDNGKVFFGKNGVWQASGNPATGANPAFSGLTGTIFPANGYNVTPGAGTTNFGATAFTYVVPAGFNSGMYA